MPHDEDILEELEVTDEVVEEEDEITTDEAPPEPEEQDEEPEIDPEKALSVVKDKYAHLLKLDDDDWEAKVVDKAVEKQQQLESLRDDLLFVARQRMGEYANDADAVDWMRKTIRATPAGSLKQALDNPAMLDGALAQYVGFRVMNQKKVAPKNTSVAPGVKEVKKSITISAEDKQAYSEMKYFIKDLPEERAKKFQDNWLKERGYK